jgi:hypothetical protein
MSRANHDYECTPDEIREFLENTVPQEPGHGTMNFIPTLEPYALTAPGVFWGNRRIDHENGWIIYDWFFPESFHPPR